MYDSRKHERITTFIVTREKQTENKLLQQGFYVLWISHVGRDDAL